QAHNLKVVGSNPTPATIDRTYSSLAVCGAFLRSAARTVLAKVAFPRVMTLAQMRISRHNARSGSAGGTIVLPKTPYFRLFQAENSG
ncbi:hypothetical protein, partial [Novosphingobium sp. UBA1939]|uniref:hypothetical protein n=1 Tax=Novosphingobium sp. UBA1939 TaxID=1946982 RepID=UPI0025F3EF9A